MENAALKIITRSKLLEGFVDVEEVVLRQRQLDGTYSPELLRYIINRPDAVCAVVENTDHGTLLFVRQVRVAVKGTDNAWFVELAAGLVDEGETLKDAVKREVKEELGYVLTNLQLLHKTYSSPGLSTERVFIYYSRVTDEQKQFPGGGNAGEFEEIEIVEVRIEDLDDLLASGKILDSKTLAGVYAFLHNRSKSLTF